MAGIKKIFITIYLALIGMIIFVPALLIPQFIFGESAGSVAIIHGAGEATSILFSAKPTKWGNVLFPVFLFLSAVNLVYLVSFVLDKVKGAGR